MDVGKGAGGITGSRLCYSVKAVTSSRLRSASSVHAEKQLSRKPLWEIMTALTERNTPLVHGRRQQPTFVVQQAGDNRIRRNVGSSNVMLRYNLLLDFGMTQ